MITDMNKRPNALHVGARPTVTPLDTPAILALEPLTWVYAKFRPCDTTELLLLLEAPRLLSDGRLIHFPSYSQAERRVCSNDVLSSESSVYSSGIPHISPPDQTTLLLPVNAVPRTVCIDRPVATSAPFMVEQMAEFCNVALILLGGESDGFKHASSQARIQIERPHNIDRDGFTWAYYGEFLSSYVEHKCLQLVNAALELYPLIADHVEPCAVLNDGDFEDDDVDFLYFELRWKKEYRRDPNHNHLLKLAYAYGIASK